MRNFRKGSGKMERVLLSGATGFIGRNLYRRLVDSGIEVVSIGRTDPKLEGVEHIECDFASSSQEDLPRDLRNGSMRFDVFYHTAWVGVNGADKKDLELQSKNSRGTELAMRIASLTKSKIITLGSASEFSASGETIESCMEPAPLDPYGLSKVWSRSMERSLAKVLDVYLVQTVVGSIYGPGRGSGDALSYALNNLIKGNTPKLDSNGEQTWQFLYIDDLIEALYYLGERGVPGKNYPISSGDSRKLSEFLKVAKSSLTKNSGLDILYGDKFGGSLEIDSSSIKVDTGWEASTTFEDGSKKLTEYLEFLNTGKGNK